MPVRPRVLVPLALLAAVSVACGGVGGSGGGGGDSDGAGGAEPKGSLSTLGFGLPDEIAKARVATFKKAYPDVSLKINEGGFDAQQFLSSVAGGNPPDLVYLDRNILGTYAERGALEPLDQCVKDRAIDMAAFRPAATAQVTIDGTVFGIPEFLSVRVVIANSQDLKASGLTTADVDASDWDKVSAANAKLTKSEGGKLSRIGFDPKLPEFLPLWARANGASIISDDGRTATLDDPKVVEALSYTLSLVKQEGGWSRMKSFRDTFDFFGAKNQFAQDQLGAFPIEDFYLNVLAEVSPKVPIVVTSFKDRQGQPITYSTGLAWAIPKGAKNPDAACAFMQKMTATDTWVAAAKAKAKERKSKKLPFTGVFTGNREADDEIFSTVYQPAGIASLDNGVKVLRSVQEHAFSLPPSPAGAEFEKAWQDAVTRALEGRQSAQAALEEAQQQAQKALDQAAK